MYAYKRYIVFAHYSYEAQGGMGDIIADFNTFDETLICVEGILTDNYDSIEVFDRVDGVEITNEIHIKIAEQAKEAT